MARTKLTEYAISYYTTSGLSSVDFVKAENIDEVRKHYDKPYYITYTVCERERSIFRRGKR